MQRQRVLDWRMLLVLCFAAVICYMFYTAVVAFQTIDEKDKQIDTLVHNNERQFAVAARERKVAAHERRLLLSYTKELSERQREIYTYLNNHGIKLPEDLIHAPKAPVLKSTYPHHNSTPPAPHHSSSPGDTHNGGGSGSRPPKSSHTKSTKGHKHSSHNSPGHSGSAPGHHKHHKHHGNGKGKGHKK